MRIAFIEGERLYLRPLEPEDLDARLSWVNDPEVQRLVGHRHPRGSDQEREWLSSRYASDSRLLLGIALRESSRLIGYCGLAAIDTANGSGVYAIIIGDKDAWNCGYGSEATSLVLTHAFEELRLHRVELEVYGNNPRAIRAYEKIGFTHEATRRESYYRDGQYFDIYVMSVLQSEWQERSAV